MNSIEGPLFLTTTLLYSREMGSFAKRSYIHHSGRTRLLKKLDWLYGLVCFTDFVLNPDSGNSEFVRVPGGIDSDIVAIIRIKNGVV